MPPTVRKKGTDVDALRELYMRQIDRYERYFQCVDRHCLPEKQNLTDLRRENNWMWNVGHHERSTPLPFVRPKGQAERLSKQGRDALATCIIKTPACQAALMEALEATVPIVDIEIADAERRHHVNIESIEGANITKNNKIVKDVLARWRKQRRRNTSTNTTIHLTKETSHVLTETIYRQATYITSG